MYLQVRQLSPQRYEPGSLGVSLWFREVEGNWALTNMSRKLDERLKATKGGCAKTVLERLEEYNRLRCFLIIEEIEGKDGL